MSDILTLPVVEIVLVGALAALTGTLAVLSRRVFFAESVSHATFPGAVLGVVMFGQHGIFAGAAVMCLLMSWVMRMISRRPSQSSQASAGVVLTLSFALGYFLNTWFRPLPVRVETFLTGSVLTVSRIDVLLVAVVLAATVVAVVLRGPHMMARAFDRESDFLVLALIVAALVVVIPAIGTILSIALVVAPAAGLARHVKSYTTLFWAAPIAGAATGLVGLGLAVAGNFSPGGTIALVAAVFYVLTGLHPSMWRRKLRMRKSS